MKMTRRTWYEMTPRQRTAVLDAMARRKDELAPLLEEIDRKIDEVGWRRAAWRIAEILYPRQFDPLPLTYRGPWRYRVGKRNGKRILAALSELPVEGRLFG
jgi:hypothetical protein